MTLLLIRRLHCTPHYYHHHRILSLSHLLSLSVLSLCSRTLRVYSSSSLCVFWWVVGTASFSLLFHRSLVAVCSSSSLSFFPSTEMRSLSNYSYSEASTVLSLLVFVRVVNCKVLSPRAFFLLQILLSTREKWEFFCHAKHASRIFYCLQQLSMNQLVNDLVNGIQLRGRATTLELFLLP